MQASRVFCRGYAAPELMVDGLVSFKADIFSLGVTILELVTGSKEKPDITNVSVINLLCSCIGKLGIIFK